MGPGLILLCKGWWTTSHSVCVSTYSCHAASTTGNTGAGLWFVHDPINLTGCMCAYSQIPMSVTGVTPTSGSLAGGSTLTITGTGETLQCHLHTDPADAHMIPMGVL
jgi:hypothetical protein